MYANACKCDGAHGFGRAHRGRGKWRNLGRTELSDLLSKQGNLRSASLFMDDSVTDATLTLLARLCPRLEKIAVTCTEVQFNSSVVVDLLSSCRSLKSIRFGGVAVSDMTLVLITKYCKNLSELGLSGCPSITDKGLMLVVQSCSHLLSLDVCKCSGLSVAGLVQMQRYCSQLTSVSFTVRSAEDVGITEYFRQAQLTALTSFSGTLHNNTVINAAVYWHNMHSLTLDRSYLSDSAVYAIARHCKHLTKLTLIHSPALSDVSMHYLVLGTSQLEYLMIMGCHGIGDDGVIALVEGCATLRTLHVACSDSVTDRSVDVVRLHKCRGSSSFPGCRWVAKVKRSGEVLL